MKKYFLFDDEQISGKTYLLRLFVSILLSVFLVGIWLVASTAYKRARSLGWDEGFSRVISFLIIIQSSIGFWPDSLFVSGSSIFIVTIPLNILQICMVLINAQPVKSSATQKWYRTGEKVGRIIGEYVYTPIKWKNILIYVGLGLLLKVLLHFSLFPEKSKELDTKNKTYVDGYIQQGWYYKGPSGLEIDKCSDSDEWFKRTGEWVDKSECHPLYIAARYQGNYEAPYTKNGERYRLEEDSNLDRYGNPTTVYYYPYKNLNLISHFGLIFKSKLWIFVISVGLTIFLTFIFRHKISSKS